jgi:hypothetical protein
MTYHAAGGGAGVAIGPVKFVVGALGRLGWAWTQARGNQVGVEGGCIRPRKGIADPLFLFCVDLLKKGFCSIVSTEATRVAPNSS